MFLTHITVSPSASQGYVVEYGESLYMMIYVIWWIILHIYGKLLYMVMYVVYGKLFVHIKGIITDEAETVPTGNMK
jgi:hypothetical protein